MSKTKRTYDNITNKLGTYFNDPNVVKKWKLLAIVDLGAKFEGWLQVEVAILLNGVRECYYKEDNKKKFTDVEWNNRSIELKMININSDLKKDNCLKVGTEKLIVDDIDKIFKKKGNGFVVLYLYGNFENFEGLNENFMDENDQVKYYNSVDITNKQKVIGRFYVITVVENT
jgi:hypothetical protein